MSAPHNLLPIGISTVGLALVEAVMCLGVLFAEGLLPGQWKAGREGSQKEALDFVIVSSGSGQPRWLTSEVGLPR